MRATSRRVARSGTTCSLGALVVMASLGCGGGNSTPGAADEVLAHSQDTLYRIEFSPPGAAAIAGFTFAGAPETMLDLATDASGDVWGVSSSSLYRVDPDTAFCSLVGPTGQFLNSLAWISGDATANAGALLGIDANGDVYIVNAITAAATLIGSLGGGLTPSGDVVSMPGLGLYATTGTGPGAPTADDLLLLDPATGAASVIGPIGGHVQVHGLARHGGQLIGFDSAGVVFSIDPVTGAPTELAPTGLGFRGAASAP